MSELPGFRPATPDDAAAIRDLVRAAYARWVPLIGREPRPMTADYDAAVREHQFDLLEEDGQLVGVIETALHPDHLWVENVAVHPDAQQRGLGKALLAEAETRARAAGLLEIRLLTNGAFATNIALYQRVGYEVTHTDPFMGGTTVYMTKRLAQDDELDQRQPFDVDAYVDRMTSGPCFICELVRGNPDFAHHIVHEDDDSIIFLSKYPTLRGYCLVSPKSHLEDLAEDLSAAQYVSLQAKVHRLSRALKRVFAAERIYVLSLGSMQGNSHLHFHVVPLPSGVPLARQQYHALMAEHGTLRIADADMARMAQDITRAYAAA